MANLKNTNINDNLELPQGTTGERPASPQEGQIRYNTDLETTEFYNGENWRPLSDTHPEATGGTVVDTDIGGVPYRIHLFTETGTDTLTVTNPGEVEYLIVAGGGGGSTAGGGAGGVVIGKKHINAQSYDIQIGSGGLGIRGDASPRPTPAENGGDSSAFLETAIGGGGGGGTDNQGIAGGSGGGAAASSKPNNPSNGGTGLQPTSSSGGFGNKGGDVTNFSSPYYAAGGGGAGQAASNQEGNVSSKGGIGILSNLTGSAKFYAGGGGGGSWSAGGVEGGLGGGGSGETRSDADPFSGGGGGGGRRNAAGGAGGSGIVIVRYPKNSSLDTEPDETRPSFQPFFYARDVRPIIARDGLVLELDAANPLSYPGTGTTWTDLSGNGNDGTLNSNVVFNSQNQGSLSFLGNTPRVSSPLQYSLFSEFTLVTFFYNQGNSGSFGIVVATEIGNNLSNGIRTNGSNITFAGFGESALSIANFLNKWGCIAVTLDQNNFARCYYNGVLTNSGNYNRSFRSSLTNIGRGSSAFGGTFRSFEGLISTVSIYNRVLSEAEITQNFNATRSRYGI